MYDTYVYRYTQYSLHLSQRRLGGSQEQPEMLALAAAMDRIKMLEAQVASKEPASAQSPLQRAAPLTPASIAAASDSVSCLYKMHASHTYMCTCLHLFRT